MDSMLPQLREAVRALSTTLHAYDDRQGASLSASQLDAILLLHAESGLTITELARRLDLDKSSTSRIAEELARQGWAVQEADPGDKRRRPLRITPRGRAKARSILAALDARLDLALAAVPAEERTELLGAVLRLAKLVAPA